MLNDLELVGSPEQSCGERGSKLSWKGDSYPDPKLASLKATECPGLLCETVVDATSLIALSSLAAGDEGERGAVLEPVLDLSELSLLRCVTGGLPSWGSESDRRNGQDASCPDDSDDTVPRQRGQVASDGTEEIWRPSRSRKESGW